MNRVRSYCFIILIAGWGCWAQDFRPEKLSEIDDTILHAIREQACPGGVLWLEHRGHTYHKAYGHRSLVPDTEAMSEDTIFDLASLTKVIACTPAVMFL